MEIEKNTYEFPPLFIIGMPRSGTKLLRGLLNGHSQISILNIETEFLPHWVRHWETWRVSTGRYEDFLEFSLKVDSLPYFIYMAERNSLISADTWFKSCDEFTVSGVFESLARHDSNAGPGMIWGDKSPGYIRHIPVLKQLFPRAKIIHIIRDVRDYCLSMNQAWGKNIKRAAHRWVSDIQKARKDSRQIQEDYLEINFEDLIEETESVLDKVCCFLNIDYQSRMLQLSTPTENLGNARGLTGILKQNKNKYKTLLSGADQKSVEQISQTLLRELGYECSPHTAIKHLSKAELLFYQAVDGINLLRFRASNQGLLNALRFYTNAFRQKK